MNKKLTFVLFGLFLGLIFVLMQSTQVFAAPAAPVDLQLTQPDGSTFIARQWGDEWLNGFETFSGYSILQLEDNWWVYAERGTDGSLIPFLHLGEPLLANAMAPQPLKMGARPDKPDTTQLRTAPPAIHAPSIGNRPVLVILAKFNNRAETYSPSHFQQIMFGASGSVRDYYQRASFNKFTLNPANETCGTANDGIVGWVNLGYNHPNTGANTDSRNQKIVKDALIAADPCVNFASFDLNGDGAISSNELHIVVVVAGYEASASGTLTPAVWAHRWSLNDVGPPTLDGVVIGDYNRGGGYSQVGEIHQDRPATFGIIAHELGHDIGWPDTYDIDGSSYGVGRWDIMASGAWNRVGSNPIGTSPALPNPWFKWMQGWITPTEIIGTRTAESIPQAATNASAFLLRPNPNGVDWVFHTKSGTGEFFLVENRQLTSYDAGLPGCGLLIWHIDESATSTNEANANENRPLVRLIQADGKDDLKNKTNAGDAGHPYPGTANNRTFNNNSNPNSRLYNGNDSLVSVTNISTCASVMTADLIYGQAITNFTLTVTKTGSGSGTVTSTPAGINCGATCSASFPSGTTVTLTASPLAGSVFAGWSGACSGTSTTCTVAMTQARSVTATFNTTGPPTTFADVPVGYWAYDFIESLYQAGITGGCATNPLRYCPENSVTRAEMAIFILRGMYGGSYQPPGVGASTGFFDVPTGQWAAPWIKQLAAEGVTSGCGGGNYCPNDPVSRDQMALFILRGIYGGSYQPPGVGASTGFFDVPTGHWAAAWIKQLAAEAITSGCGGGNYCPNGLVTRAEMAVFLVRAFVDGVTPPQQPTGFNSQFNGHADNWLPRAGAWYVDTQYLFTYGIAGKAASVSYNATYTNFDYQVKMGRFGTITDANGIYVRGTPLPLQTNNLWRSGYLIQYAKEGKFSVWRINPNGTGTALQNWTFTPAIVQGDNWNILRVVANGSSLSFYINGSLVWTGTDATYSSGQVGIRMFRDASSTLWEELVVDWATLATGGGGSGALPITRDVISPEQQALNNAANNKRQGTINSAD